MRRWAWCFVFTGLWQTALGQEIPANCLQLIVVESASWTAVQGKLQRYERTDTKSKWKKVGTPIKVVIGKSGMGWDRQQVSKLRDMQAPFKREGDGKAPAGLFPLLCAYGYQLPQKQWKIPYIQVNEKTLCIDDPQSRYYNQIICLDTIAHSDWKSYENMLRQDDLYRLGIVIGYNTAAISGNGSCIFMHLREGSTGQARGTAGCTAMLYQDLLQIINWLDAAKKPMLLQLPTCELSPRRKAIGLP
ncbi:MAG: hypothetical protein RMJ44_08930 [Cytophagales bacterium]|nr:hypothetical protein [Bernardetiaceae bacterium]MDW8211197.1 hypothetical protein [Cytophagales bacterium]